VSSPTPNPIMFGAEIEIIRQRFFIKHTSKFNRSYSEEYTLRCKTINEKGIDNIIIKSPKLLPNLKIYDSDGTELALVTNRLTTSLIKYLLKNTNNPPVEKELKQLLDDISEQKIFLLWIKLPSAKKFFKNEVRVIKLEYEASERDESERNNILEFHSAPHEVFYVISSPTDYEFDKKEIEIYEGDGTILKNQREGWEKQKGDPFYFNTNQDSISIRVSPSISDQIKFSYSFKASENITFIPIFTMLLLSITSVFLLLSLPYFQICPNLHLTDCSVVNTIATNHVEIGIGIIIGSLAMPNLIQNQDIRHSLKYYFIFPVCVAIFGIIL
jgi:hypothetical protein